MPATISIQNESAGFRSWLARVTSAPSVVPILYCNTCADGIGAEATLQHGRFLLCEELRTMNDSDPRNAWKEWLVRPACVYVAVCLYLPAMWLANQMRNDGFSPFDIEWIAKGGLTLLATAIPLLIFHLTGYVIQQREEALEDHIGELQSRIVQLEPHRHGDNWLTCCDCPQGREEACCALESASSILYTGDRDGHSPV